MAATSRFDRDAAKNDMLEGLASDFNNEASNWDIEIRCNAHVWTCHKHILSNASKWFQHAFTDKDGDADRSKHYRRDSIETPLPKDQPVGEDAMEAMLRFCYTFDYNDRDKSDPATFNVRVFAVAEKFSVKGLDRLAVDKFLASASKSTLPGLMQAISEAYVICSDSGRILKNAIIEHVSEREDFLKNFSGENKEYNELMDSTSGFAVDIIKALAKKLQTSRKRQAESSESPPKRQLLLFVHLYLTTGAWMAADSTGAGSPWI